MKRRAMRIAALGLISAFIFAACSTSAASRAPDDVYAVGLQGQATTDGVLVLTKPRKIEVDLTAGSSSLDVALSLREALNERGHEVICVTHQGGDAFSVLVRGRVEISSERSNLGGIGGSAAQVIQRPEVIQSTVREYLRFLREDNAASLRGIVAQDFRTDASADLGKAIELVSIGAPVTGCHSASVVVEVELPNGSREQNELHLVTEGDLNWRIAGVTRLASWQS